MRRRNALLLAGAMAPLLSGCVAAALPLVAAGAVARRESTNDARRASEPVVEVLPGIDPEPAARLTPVTPPAEPATTSAQPVALTASETVAVASSAPTDAGIPPISSAPPPPANGEAWQLPPAAPVVVAVAPYPARPATPAAGPPAVPPINIAYGRTVVVNEAALAAISNGLPVPASSGDQPYDAFIRFAMQQADRREGGQLRETVMLSGPPMNGTLPLLPCGFLPPAVIVDLDDGSGTGLNLATATTDTGVRAAAGLAESLNELRRRDVAVIWMTSQPFDRFDTLSALLRSTGLDSTGNDTIVLTRSTTERKQERRTQTAASHCILAIAGDRKADFDELYDYLRNPDLPIESDRMIGAGWFLAPPPLAAAEPATTPQP